MDRYVEQFFKAEKSRPGDGDKFLASLHGRLTYYRHYKIIARQLEAERRRGRYLTLDVTSLFTNRTEHSLIYSEGLILKKPRGNDPFIAISLLGRLYDLLKYIKFNLFCVLHLNFYIFCDIINTL